MIWNTIVWVLVIIMIICFMTPIIYFIAWLLSLGGFLLSIILIGSFIGIIVGKAIKS